MASAGADTSSENGTVSGVRRHRWIATFKGGPQRVIHASVLIGDIIYVFGGCRLENLDEEHEPIEILTVNITNFKWKILGPTKQSPAVVPFMRFGHAVAEHNGYVYLFGGRSSFKFCNELFRYDPVAHRWQKLKTSGDPPRLLLGHSMSVVGNIAYVYGGLDNVHNISTNEMYALDLENHEWSLVQLQGEFPVDRYYHTASVIERKIYIFGGQTRRNSYGDGKVSHCDKIYFFDTETLTWHCPKQNGHIPCGRRSHSGFVYEGRMYIHGGHSDSTAECHGDMHRFDPRTGEWEMFPTHVGDVKIPPSRRSHTLVLAGDRVFMIGGITIVHADGDPEDEGGLETEDGVWDEWPGHKKNNFYVLDMKPSLKTMCLSKVIQYNLDRRFLPRTLQTVMSNMFTLKDVMRTAYREQ